MMGFFTGRLETINNFFQTQRFVWADLKNSFSWDYWTEANLPPQTPYFFASLLFIILLIATLVFSRRRLQVAQAVAPVYGGPINQLANVIAFIIVMAVSYEFFRAQAITYLSSRLVVLASLTIIVVWVGWIIFYLLCITPTRSREYLERERFFRYIPKGKANDPKKKK